MVAIIFVIFCAFSKIIWYWSLQIVRIGFLFTEMAKKNGGGGRGQLEFDFGTHAWTRKRV